MYKQHFHFFQIKFPFLLRTIGGVGKVNLIKIILH